MRKVAYKAKLKDGGKWIQANGIMVHKDGTVIMPISENEKGFTTSPVDPKTVCECTNQPDRQNTPIYENDTVETYAGIGRVEFRDTIGWCVVIKGKTVLPLVHYRMAPKGVIVTGNTLDV